MTSQKLVFYVVGAMLLPFLAMSEVLAEQGGECPLKSIKLYPLTRPH